MNFTVTTQNDNSDALRIQAEDIIFKAQKTFTEEKAYQAIKETSDIVDEDDLEAGYSLLAEKALEGAGFDSEEMSRIHVDVTL